jgi:tellurite resistance protein TerA
MSKPPRRWRQLLPPPAVAPAPVVAPAVAPVTVSAPAVAPPLATPAAPSASAPVLLARNAKATGLSGGRGAGV